MNGDSSTEKFGVYCLANDRFIEWLELFARSFRWFHPSLPLTVIPYNADVRQLRRLAPRYNFELMSESVAAPFDALEPKVMKVGHHAGMFRKWASFFGPYEHFMFFDADIAITMPLDGIFAAFEKSATDFLYFDTDITMVYKPQFVAEMQAKYHSPGFNAGAYVSRKGVVTRELLWQKAEEAETVCRMFCPIQDQPFLNYIMDTLPRRMASVNSLLPQLSPKPWARVPFTLDPRRNTVTDVNGLPMPFIHWAGCGFPTMVRPEIFLHYRTLSMGAGERLAYVLNFYYRRFRRQFRNILLKNALSTKVLAWRDRHLRTI